MRLMRKVEVLVVENEDENLRCEVQYDMAISRELLVVLRKKSSLIFSGTEKETELI